MYKFLSLKDHVYQYIAEQISKEELVPGEKINENEICRELSISRTPVRERSQKRIYQQADERDRGPPAL